jgi:hypothetical protein
MVMVLLQGGLGNQLFQYATGRAVAARHKVPLLLDLGALEKDPRRSYRLGHYNVCAAIASPEQVAERIGYDRKKSKLHPLRWIGRAARPLKGHIIYARQFQFDARVMNAPANAYLAGYWSSARYFEGIAPLLRKELTVREEPDEFNAALAGQIRECEAVSVHVRRTDYVTDLGTNRHHGALGREYYAAAVEYLTARVAEPHFFVFSDDTAWTRANLAFSHPATFVEHNGAARDYEDLRLMALCGHHILANSSFSWWGAWLGTRREPVVVAPKRWFADGKHDTRDLYLPGWTRL